MLKINVGGLDRLVRVLAGLALLAAFFVFPDSAYRYFFLVGIIPLATGLMASCPLYSLFGLSSCPMKKS